MAREPIYLTKDGLEKIKEELRYLKEVRRQEISDYMGSAIADGDIRESAAYDDARQQQSANEARIADLEEIVARATVVERKEGAEAVITLGAHVTLDDGDGNTRSLRLVGTHEADILDQKISDESPIGRQLVGRRVGEQVTHGKTTYTITEVTFR